MEILFLFEILFVKPGSIITIIMNLFTYWITPAKRCFLFCYSCHPGWLLNTVCTCRNQSACAPGSELALVPYTQGHIPHLWSWHYLDETPSLGCRVFQGRSLGSWAKVLSAAMQCSCAEGPQRSHRGQELKKSSLSPHVLSIASTLPQALAMLWR